MFNLRGQLDTLGELLDKLSNRVFKRRRIPVRIGVMENILKEVGLNWPLGKRSHQVLSLPLTGMERGSVVGAVLVMSFSAAFVLIFIPELGQMVHVGLLDRHNFSPPDCCVNICPFPSHNYFAEVWGDRQLQR